ncbi:MAG: rRNA pseudouridine synthase [Hyellaceae cyanobacterium CSU_1_1]|nr:rRNA pseudouridine synthase [Hyellaceae cyanobacterium CSU_1_1]
MAERVQKVLSQWGIASRRKAEKMIVAGRVSINNQIAKLGDRVDLTQDSLQVDGKEVRQTHRPQLLYLLLHKPVGVVSTCDDPQKRTTVIDLLPKELSQGSGIHPVGRLDFASSGALILTNDGELTLGLTHPRYHLPKTYLVKLNRSLSRKDLTYWRSGIVLDHQKTLPAKINFAESDPTGKTLEIVLTEGRNRQIRRVAQQLGYEVTELHRVAIGSITLNISHGSKLSPSKYRHLQKTELNFLRDSFNLNCPN